MTAMHTQPDPVRRTLLEALAAAGALALLAGCRSPVKTMTAQTPTPTPTLPNLPAFTAAGPTLRVVAPSGLMPSAARAERGVLRLARAGYQLSNTQCLARRYQRFAGTDAERAADFNDIRAGDVPKFILAARGGYGAMRLLPWINWQRLCPLLKEAGTLVMGFSDFTAIQMGLLSQGGVVSFAGPMLYSDFGAEAPSVLTMSDFVSTTTARPLAIRVEAPFSPTLKAEGVLWGGNLTVLAHLAGTPYLPKIDGGILFIEDVGEQPYRVERMLQQLNLAGVLSRQKAIVFGDFDQTNIRDYYDSSYTLATVASHVGRVTGVPVLTGFPFGHTSNKATFPLGAHASLTSDGAGYRVTFPDYPTYPLAGLNTAALTELM
ncbi:LD-carboxypeptidase [Crenobacter intestini]|nr:LD-carboxypeptidase [Crenobacter intestini]